MDIDLESCERTIAIWLNVVIIIVKLQMSLIQLFIKLIDSTSIRNILVDSEQLIYIRPSTSFSGHF